VKLFRIYSAFSLAFLLTACSTSSRKGETVVSAEKAEAPKTIAVNPLKLSEQPEPKGAAGKTSWTEYMSGVRALEAEDPLTAMHYFDLALEEVLSEQKADSVLLPEDSFYYSMMPQKILSALESLYPQLVLQGSSEGAYSMLNDYEGIDDFEETPLDSAEREALEDYLDAMDLSKFSLPMVINDRVMQEIHYLTVNARKFTEASLSRKTLLDSMIYAKLRARGMPEDLIYLAFVESGYKVNAYSRAKAAGVWQFIPATGRRYGLSSDFWVDTRRNPEAATDAALDYLSALYKEFGDWHLAMAAYNCGEGRIRRLVKEGLEDPAKKISFWDLKLPRETMHYVPRILAATIIGHNPEHYSFKVEKQIGIPFDTVSVKDCVPLDKIGGAVGASVNTIRDLNPELLRWCTPPNTKSYTIRVPKGSRDKFLTAYAKMDKTQLVRWQQYRVQRGDNLGYIARQFGMKVSDIQAANNLRGTKLSVGQILIIPMPAGATAPGSASTKRQAAESSGTAKKDESGMRTYTTQRGDNLGSISRRFGVSSQSLMEWNNLQNNKIMVGQMLYLQDPAKKEAKKSEDLAKKLPAPANGADYEIKPGDNLWEIARMHNVTVQQLLDWNPGLEKKIFPGMKIKVRE
jgi:membrane-bound lytic murein transglycosylase D